MNEVIKLLTEKNKTISTMESCTGGGIANAITNIEGSSEVFKFGAVTYSNEYKIKMGVSSNIIDKYTVYSTETSNEMSKNISNYTNSNYGIGVTGKLNRVDKFNLYGEDNIVYISIYDRDNNNYYNERGTCLGAKTQLAILSDGTVSICCLDSEGVSNLGNIYLSTMEDILASDKYQNILKGFNDNKVYLDICKHCSYKERFDKK